MLNSNKRFPFFASSSSIQRLFFGAVFSLLLLAPLTTKGVAQQSDSAHFGEPAPPYPYLTENVTYVNSAAGITLAGTLTYPRTGKPFPAVVLITGSGAQDRNEEIFGHKFFLTWADYLTRNGIEVLRVDDRGVGGSTGKFDTSKTSDFVTDVEASVQFLLKRPEVDRKHVGLIGHSEGGLVAPMVSAQDPNVHFIVLLAGPGIPVRELMTEQRQILAGEIPGSPLTPTETTVSKLDSIVLATFDTVSERSSLDKFWKSILATQTDTAAFKPADWDRMRKIEDSQLGIFMSPWYREFIRMDPRPTLARIKIPVLAVDGSLDKQVVPAINLHSIDSVLTANGNTDHEVHELPNLNHLFQFASTGLPDEYEMIHTSIDPSVMDYVTKWILRHVH